MLDGYIIPLIPSTFRAILIEFCSFFSPFFDSIFLPITEYFQRYPNDLFDALAWTPAMENFFNTHSFGTVYLGAGLSIILIWNVIKFFIP